MSEFFVHESSYVDDNVTIGKGTKIWHFCHIQSGAVIGEGCSFGQNVNVSNNVKIGNGCKVHQVTGGGDGKIVSVLLATEVYSSAGREVNVVTNYEVTILEGGVELKSSVFGGNCDFLVFFCGQGITIEVNLEGSTSSGREFYRIVKLKVALELDKDFLILVVAGVVLLVLLALALLWFNNSTSMQDRCIKSARMCGKGDILQQSTVNELHVISTPIARKSARSSLKH